MVLVRAQVVFGMCRRRLVALVEEMMPIWSSVWRLCSSAGVVVVVLSQRLIEKSERY